MEIDHEKGNGRGRFVTSGGASEMTYLMADEKTAVFDHTFVPPQERGQGIAAKLVDAGVAWARAEDLKIVPQCPYVDVLFRREPEKYADVAAR